MKPLGHSIASILVLMISCSPQKWVSKEYAGNVRHDFMMEYTNDSFNLKFNLFALAFDIQKQHYLKSVPKIIRENVKKEAGRKGKILFVEADTTLSPNQFYYIGILGNYDVTDKFTIKKAKSLSKYYINNFQRINKSLYFGKVLIPVKNKMLSVLFFDLKKQVSDGNLFYKLHFFEKVIDNLLYDNLRTMEAYSYENKPSVFEYYNSVASKAKGNSLSIIYNLAKEVANYDEPNDKYFLYELIATHYSMLDELRQVKMYIEKQDSVTSDGNKTNKNVPTFFYSDYYWSDALSEVLKQAKKYRVTMINESHFDWRHRYFVTILLDSLKAAGYKQIAFEGLDYKDDSLLIRSYPINKTGIYISEPYFGNLIRSALEKGFKLIPYEDTLESENREYSQAINLFNSYLKDTSSKLLVLAGYGHINRDTNSLKMSMAGYFEKLIKEKVLTVNQAYYSDIFFKKPFFSDKPVGYYSTSNMPGINGDIIVVNNIKDQPLENLSAINGSEIYKIKLTPKYLDANNYLFIYNEKEYIKNKKKSVPIYIRQLDLLQDTIQLNLKQNKYVAVLRNTSGEDICLYNLKP